MLKYLANYAESEGIISEPGFETRGVHWAVNVSKDGHFLGVEDLRQGKTPREYRRCPKLSQPEKVAGGKARSHFLVESAGLLLSCAKPENDPKKERKRSDQRAFFIGLLDQCAIYQEGLIWLEGAIKFLNSAVEVQEAAAELLSLKGKPGDNIVVTVESRNPLDSDCWHAWWREYRRTFARKPSRKVQDHEKLARDLLTGDLVVPAKTHPTITGLSSSGGSSNGDRLICFDKAAFCSYGLQQSLNAPLSEEAAAQYAAGLRHLVARGRQLAGNKICYWYSRPAVGEDDLFSTLLDLETSALGISTDVEALVRSIQKGTGGVSIPDRFYCLVLSGNSGRVMVRDWCEGSFESLQHAVSSWFSDLSIVQGNGSGLARPPKFWAVLASLFRDPTKEIPSPLVQELFHRAIHANPLPANILALAVKRIRSDLVDPDAPTLNHARMGLLKAYLNRKNGEQTVTTHLRNDHPDPAYHCGRLLAILAQLQKRAIPGVDAGVVQRFYGAASQTPALVFGRLVANGQNHLSKLDAGLAHIFNDSISRVLDQIDHGFPKTLNLEKQSLFALGYYQQLAENRRQSAEKIAQKRTVANPDNEGEINDEPY